MKTAISMPDDVFRTADHFAREQKLSRSALVTRAVVDFLAHPRREGVTERLRVRALDSATMAAVDDGLRLVLAS